MFCRSLAGLHFYRWFNANALQTYSIDQHVINRKQQQATADQERRRSQDCPLCAGTDTSPRRYFLKPYALSLIHI